MATAMKQDITGEAARMHEVLAAQNEQIMALVRDKEELTAKLGAAEARLVALDPNS